MPEEKSLKHINDSNKTLLFNLTISIPNQSINQSININIYIYIYNLRSHVREHKVPPNGKFFI